MNYAFIPVMLVGVIVFAVGAVMWVDQIGKGPFHDLKRVDSVTVPETVKVEELHDGDYQIVKDGHGRGFAIQRYHKYPGWFDFGHTFYQTPEKAAEMVRYVMAPHPQPLDEVVEVIRQENP